MQFTTFSILAIQALSFGTVLAEPDYSLTGLARITYNDLMEGSSKFKGVYLEQDDGTTESIPVRVLNSIAGKQKVNDKWVERCDGHSYEGKGYLFCR